MVGDLAVEVTPLLVNVSVVPEAVDPAMSTVIAVVPSVSTVTALEPVVSTFEAIDSDVSTVDAVEPTVLTFLAVDPAEPTVLAELLMVVSSIVLYEEVVLTKTSREDAITSVDNKVVVSLDTLLLLVKSLRLNVAVVDVDSMLDVAGVLKETSTAVTVVLVFIGMSVDVSVVTSVLVDLCVVTAVLEESLISVSEADDQNQKKGNLYILIINYPCT